MGGPWLVAAGPVASRRRPSSQPVAPTASVDRSGSNHVQTHTRTDPLVAATIVPFALVHNPFTGFPFSRTLIDAGLEALSLTVTG